jgi:putative DNA primase/helicase
MITIIKADKDLCKKTDGKGGLLPYQNAFLYESETQNVKSIEEFSALLTELENRPRHGILRDEPLENSRGRRTKERYKLVPREWLLLDHDAPAPQGCPDYVQSPDEAFSWMVDNHWQFLKGVGVHWQLGNSAGVVPASEKMSWHLWVLLDTPVCNASRWLGAHGFDVSMTNPVQIHYTASPMGVNVPKRSGLVIGGRLSGVTENPPHTRSGLKYQDGYQCTEMDITMLDMELETLNGDKGRHGALRWWVIRAVTVNYPDAHDRAVDKLVSWGRGETTAHSEVARLIAWAQTGLADGSIEVDPILRPDLVFSDDEENAVVDNAEEQAEALGCSSLIRGLTDAEDRFDWLKENAPRVAKLDPLEMGRIRDAWGTGVRTFDKTVKAAKPQITVDGQIFESDDWGALGAAYAPTTKGLVYSEEVFYSYVGRKYEESPSEVVAQGLSDYMSQCFFESADAPPQRIKPNVGRVANALQQVKFATMRHGIHSGTWLDTGVISGTPFKNGVLVGSELMPHSSEYFSTYCLDYDYDTEATCPLWEAKVVEWLDGDGQRVDLLRQWMKYLLSGRDDLQKIWVLAGVPRSGKGTITTLLRSLLGFGNCSTPLMGQFVYDFGLENSLGKRAIIIGDAHINKGDPAGILDKLKSISGKDMIQVNRKNKAQVNAVLGQIVLACNDLADIPDESNALISRYSILNFKKSFVGMEDPTLMGRLLRELSGIYNWAMGAQDFVNFNETEEEKKLKEGLVTASNPVRAWGRSQCVEGSWVSKEDLYRSYENWCNEMHARSKGKGAFFKTLYQVYPYSKEVRKRINGSIQRGVEGLALRDADDIFPSEPIDEV